MRGKPKAFAICVVHAMIVSPPTILFQNKSPPQISQIRAVRGALLIRIRFPLKNQINMGYAHLCVRIVPCRSKTLRSVYRQRSVGRAKKLAFQEEKSFNGFVRQCLEHRPGAARLRLMETGIDLGGEPYPGSHYSRFYLIFASFARFLQDWLAWR